MRPRRLCSTSSSKSGSSFDSFANLQNTTLEIAQPIVGFTAHAWVDGPFPAGTWKILLSDSVQNDTGFVDGVAINFQPVPEPTHAALATSLLMAGGVTLRALRGRARKAGTILEGL